MLGHCYGMLWINTAKFHIFGGMNIHLPSIFEGHHKVLTHPHKM